MSFFKNLIGKGRKLPAVKHNYGTRSRKDPKMDTEALDRQFSTFLSGVVEGKFNNFHRPLLSL